MILMHRACYSTIFEITLFLSLKNLPGAPPGRSEIHDFLKILFSKSLKNTLCNTTIADNLGFSDACICRSMIWLRKSWNKLTIITFQDRLLSCVLLLRRVRQSLCNFSPHCAFNQTRLLSLLSSHLRSCMFMFLMNFIIIVGKGIQLLINVQTAECHWCTAFHYVFL